MIKIKIKKGDEVIVITGKDKGKKGQVLKVLPSKGRLIVAGINVVKRHTKPTRQSEVGIIQKESAIHVSNVAHIDPKLGVATKIACKLSKDGSKLRVAKKSGEIIEMEGK